MKGGTQASDKPIRESVQTCVHVTATEKHSMSRVAVAQAHDVDILIIYNKHYFPIQLTNVVLAD